jgi:hypothetical protein
VPRRKLHVPCLAAAPLFAWLWAWAWAWAPSAAASGPEVPGSGAVIERGHEIELSVAREGATLVVTRTLFNAGALHAEAHIPVPLPCEASVDEVAIQERDGSWRAAELLDPREASSRWWHWKGGPEAGVNAVLDADTALLATRDDYGCEAEFSLYPIPPLASRSISYRVFVPSSYAEGRHTIELGSFDAHGLPATLELEPPADPGLELFVDGHTQPTTKPTQLAGELAHDLVLKPRDRGRAQVRAVDLELAELVERTPAAAAKLAAKPEEAPSEHLLMTELEAPSELAALPPIRRVVVLIDGSRSFDSSARDQLQALAGRYFEALVEADPHTPIRAEVLIFDREPRRIYHDFVPAAWLAEDLPKLEVGDENGSELGLALTRARELLEDQGPTNGEGADWILVFSDLYLRADFDVAAEHQAAASTRPRMHFVRPAEDRQDFGPALADDPWTAVARESGGMLWDTPSRSYDWYALAEELIQPTRIWSLTLELQLEGGEHRELSLRPYLEAGETHRYTDFDHAGPGLERAAFVGEVWGQRRAWTAAPSEAAGRRLAASFATHDEHGDLSEASRTALAHYAGVVSRFTSGWALASFGGPAPAPSNGSGFGSIGGASSYSIGCGGARGHYASRVAQPQSFTELAEAVLAKCPDADEGSFSFETTEIEIVAVDAGDACVREQTWALDIRPTRSAGRRVIEVEYAAGQVTRLDFASPQNMQP